MAPREPFKFTATEALPAPQRAGVDGVGRASPYDALVAEVKANPGTWYELECANDNQAYSRATTLRKSYDLDAHARNGMVYVKTRADEPASA